MNPIECEFEPEALAAALQSRFPEHVDAGLRAHIAGCAICSDTIAMAAALDGAREEIGAVVPDGGRVWRAAQIRAHREDAQAAGSPITAVQFIAFACAVGLLGACFGATSTRFQSALNVAALNAKPLLLSAVALFVHHGTILLAMAAVFFVVSTAVVLVLRRD